MGKVALAIIGTKGLDKGIDLIKLSAKSGKLASLASRINKDEKLAAVDEMLIIFGESKGIFKEIADARTLFRGDSSTVTPDIVFNKGFMHKGSHDDLELHVTSNTTSR